MMQDLVGIVRIEDEMLQALKGLDALKARAAQTASRAIASTTPAGTRPRICGTC